MNHITRAKKELKNLSATDQAFKSMIQGMTKEQAYQCYLTNKGIYHYNTIETKTEFAAMNHKRCSFCTKRISDFHMVMTIEHIETKRDCPQKIYEWENLLCACRACNTKRSTNKYVPNKYLDPTKLPEIETYFSFDIDGSIAPNQALSEKAQEQARYMIQLYKLDRDELNVERREFFHHLLDDEYFEILKKRSKDSMDIHFLSVFTYYKRRMDNGQ